MYKQLPQPDALFAQGEARCGLGGVLSCLPNCLYVNNSANVARAENKPAQLCAAARLGLPVPATIITNDVAAAREFAARYGPVVYKPMRSPRLHAGQARTIWAQTIDPTDLDESLLAMPHLLQSRVDKVADLRVTVIGERVFAVRIECVELDWRAVDDSLVTYTPTPVTDDLAHRVRRYLDAFGLVFGCFDFAVTAAGRAVFLECNPNGQWAWLPGADTMAVAFADILERGTR